MSTAAIQQFTDVAAALPAGTTLTVDRASYRRTGAVASVTVTAVRPGQPSSRFSVVLVREAGRWKVSGTYPLGSAQ